jgi:hypothetical protein
MTSQARKEEQGVAFSWLGGHSAYKGGMNRLYYLCNNTVMAPNLFRKNPLFLLTYSAKPPNLFRKT